MHRYWAEYGTTAFADVDPDKTIAILPTAAIEQHGPHLPVGVDTMIADGMLRTVVERASGDLDFRILPVQAVGKSNEHLHAPGTLTLPADLCLRLWVEIGRSVARAGVRKLVIVNSHGGNLDLVGVVARELRVEAGMLAVKCQWGSFGHPPGAVSDAERTHGIHGGEVETSLMLHFRPDLVDMDKAGDFRSTAETSILKPTGLPSYGWIASDLHPSGTVGNAAAGTASLGKAVAEHQADGFLALLQDVAAFDMTRFAMARG